MSFRIVLERAGNTAPNQEQRKYNESYVRETLSCITHKIHIQSIWTEYGQLMVDYERLAGAVGVDFKVLIQDAIAMRADLTLVSVQVPGKVIEVQGLELARQTDKFTEYKVFPVFFKKLSFDDEYRHAIASKNIVDITFELEEAGNIKGCYILPVSSVIFAPGLLAVPNAYNKLAQRLCQDQALREHVRLDACVGLDVILKSDGSLETHTHDNELKSTASLTNTKH